MKTLALSVLIFLCSCARTSSFQEPEFTEYLKFWQSIYNLDYDYIEMRFSDTLEDDVAGVCHSTGLIEIDRAYWHTISIYTKRNLIFHELGHCILGLDHNNAVNPIDKCPESYMHERLMSTTCWKKRYPNW